MKADRLSLLILFFVALTVFACDNTSGEYKTQTRQVTDAKNLPSIRERVTKDFRTNSQSSNNIFNYAILKVVDSPSTSDLHRAIDLFDRYLQNHPADTKAQISKGYAFVLLAELYLEQKNYFKAAEYSKIGFYLMDEAVEQKPDDLSLRLMRGRFDAQTPRALGRYVITIKDIKYLLAHKNKIPAGTEPLLYFLLAKAYTISGDDNLSQAQIILLRKLYPKHPLSHLPLGQMIMISDNELLAMFRLQTTERN